MRESNILVSGTRSNADLKIISLANFHLWSRGSNTKNIIVLGFLNHYSESSPNNLGTRGALLLLASLNAKIERKRKWRKWERTERKKEWKFWGPRESGGFPVLNTNKLIHEPAFSREETVFLTITMVALIIVALCSFLNCFEVGELSVGWAWAFYGPTL